MTKGPGRKATYSDTMETPIAVRFNEEQAAAVDKWCRKHGVVPSALVREAVLEQVDARLARGMTATKWGEDASERFVACSLPVRFTAKQAASVRARCERTGAAVATFIRECTLTKIGASGLGVTRGLA